MKIKNLLRNALQKTGFDFIRYPYGDEKRKMELIFNNKINLILDVGANQGQFALNMRKLGYKEKIISFEPLSSAYNTLYNHSLKDNNWIALNFALGNFDGETKINISSNSYSSSILDMLPSHLNAAPNSAYCGSEDIKVKKLDSILDDYTDSNSIIFLKIDTQGYEKNVLEGAKNSLDKIIGIQVEMSLVELYQGEMLYYETINYLRERGFKLCLIENEFYNPSNNELLQINGVFFKV